MQANRHTSPAQFISAWVRENRPEQLAYLGAPPPLPEEATVTLQDVAGVEPLELLQVTHPPACLVVSGFLENMSKDAAIRLLAGYRNALIQSMMVFVDLAEAELEEQEFFRLGFRHCASFEHERHQLEAFEYNLKSYNFKRLWNNADHWANPENFGKYWW